MTHAASVGEARAAVTVALVLVGFALLVLVLWLSGLAARGRRDRPVVLDPIGIDGAGRMHDVSLLHGSALLHHATCWCRRPFGRPPQPGARRRVACYSGWPTHTRWAGPGRRARR